MELGISTDYDGEFQEITKIEESIRLIAEAGFTHMHWCYEWDSDYMYSRAEMEQVKEWMKKYGLKAQSLHASKGSGAYSGHLQVDSKKNYLSTTEYNRIAGVELIKNRVELANVLGATEIVLHMCLPILDFAEIPGAKETFYTQAYRSFDELEPFCREKNVRICVENLFMNQGELQDEQIEQFDRLFERYSAEFLGLCLDVGHGYLVWGNEFITKFADRYKDRLYSIHLHDNWGWQKDGNSDAHALPGEGKIDWEALKSVLSKSAYKGAWVLEVVNSTGEDALKYLKRAREAGEKVLAD